MKLKNNKSGFTLLEIIIVIIIVGVLASLALPRFFSLIEYAKVTEALASHGVIRQSMERCYLQRAADYTDCDVFANLDIEDPGNSPNAHFNYGVTAAGPAGYTLTATRLALDGGNAGDTVVLIQTTAVVTRSGTGAFSGLN